MANVTEPEFEYDVKFINSHLFNNSASAPAASQQAARPAPAPGIQPQTLNSTEVLNPKFSPDPLRHPVCNSVPKP